MHSCTTSGSRFSCLHEQRNDFERFQKWKRGSSFTRCSAFSIHHTQFERSSSRRCRVMCPDAAATAAAAAMFLILNTRGQKVSDIRVTQTYFHSKYTSPSRLNTTTKDWTATRSSAKGREEQRKPLCPGSTVESWNTTHTWNIYYEITVHF